MREAERLDLRQSTPRGWTWVVCAYGAMALGSLGLLLLILNRGQRLLAPDAGPINAGRAASAGPDVLWHLLLAMAAVVIVGRLLGVVFRRIGQPPVIAEVVGGILLGPSLLGWIAPEISSFFLPPSVAPFLGVVAQLGVILYMFLVGIELNPEHFRARAHAIVATSHASIVVPFVLGAALSLYLYPRFSTSDTPFVSFALFLGLAMSVTAFPVLARILSDRGMTRSELGTIALTCAAVDDVTAWCLLAFVVGTVQSNAQGAWSVAALTLGFIGFMLLVARPIVRGATRRFGDRNPTEGAIAFALAALLLSALAAEAIGIHAIFGAFLLGAIIPHDSKLANTLKGSIDNLVRILLLPAFFAFTGMRTQVGLMSDTYTWLVCGLIIAVATAGKFGGTLIAGRVTGMAWRQSAALGVLMNTRGLMELIVLNVGLDLGVISPTIFTMMVLMALVTTIATTPILRRLVPAEGN